MTYSIPVEFDFSKTKQALNLDQKKNLTLPPKTILRIFGTVGSGKGTLSKMLSKYFAIPSIDSGKIWRAVTYAYSQTNFENNSENTDFLFTIISSRLTSVGLELTYNDLILTDKELRNPTIDGLVSNYAKHRSSYNTFLIRLLENNSESLVLDGRGGKTPYLIKAKNNGYTIIKIFLFSSLEIAARRRALDYAPNNQSIDFESLVEETKQKIIVRDKNDYEYCMAQNLGWVDEDTFALDTTELSIQEVFETSLWHIANKIKNQE